MKDITIEKIVYVAGALFFLIIQYFIVKRYFLLKSLGYSDLKLIQPILTGIIFILLAAFCVFLFIISKEEKDDGEEDENSNNS